MYLNLPTKEKFLSCFGLTLTWDVFKYESKKEYIFQPYRLTLTWDVFKFLKMQ